LGAAAGDAPGEALSPAGLLSQATKVALKVSKRAKPINFLFIENMGRNSVLLGRLYIFPFRGGGVWLPLRGDMVVPIFPFRVKLALPMF